MLHKSNDRKWPNHCKVFFIYIKFKDARNIPREIKYTVKLKSIYAFLSEPTSEV